MRCVLFSMLLITNAVVYAQSASRTAGKGTTFIRLNPLGLADLYDLNISFGAERKVCSKVSFAMDAAWVLYSIQYREAKSTRGFILRPAIRYFPGGNTFFLEAEFHYKQVTHRMHGWVGRNMVDGVPAYEQFMPFRHRKTSMGPHLKTGQLRPVSKNRKLWMEVYIGFGWHWRKFKVVDHPHMQYQGTNEFVIRPTEDDESVPALPAGFRLLYRL